MLNRRILLAKRSKQCSEFNIYKKLIYFYMPHIFKEQQNCNLIKIFKRNQSLKKKKITEFINYNLEKISGKSCKFMPAKIYSNKLRVTMNAF